MSKPSDPPLDEDEHVPIADPALFFRDEAPARPSSETPGVPPSSALEEGYALEGLDEGPDAGPIIPPIPVVPSPRPKAKHRPEAPIRESRATVDPVWTRWGEWGPDLIRLGAAAFGVGFLVWITAQVSGTLAIFVFLLGGLALLVLCYPLFITLERPVRITPEQAVRDYYGALSHLRPHYRRMWLLLSSEGRDSIHFQEFAMFRDYWKSELARLKGEAGGQFNTFAFEVEEFSCERSAGLTFVIAECSVKIVEHVLQDESVREKRHLKLGLIKGPDKMWYLNRGDWPEDVP